MVKVIEGNLLAKGKTFGLVASRFNDFMTKELVSGCIDTLKRHGADDKDITVAKSKAFDALICLGTVIRGATPHFDYIASEVAKGVAKVSLDTGIPVIFGVITADSIEQAVERAGSKDGNKGRDAALSAIEMVNLTGQLK